MTVELHFTNQCYMPSLGGALSTCVVESPRNLILRNQSSARSPRGHPDRVDRDTPYDILIAAWSDRKTGIHPRFRLLNMALGPKPWEVRDRARFSVGALLPRGLALAGEPHISTINVDVSRSIYPLCLCEC
jgi:hypothetical protein